METYVIGEEGASWAKGGTRPTGLQARAAAFIFTLTGLLGYTLDRCVFSFPTVQFKKQLIVWSLYFWFGALMMRVTGISIPLWSMVLSKSDSLAALQLSRKGGHGWAGDTNEFSIFWVQISHKHSGRYEGHCQYQRWTVTVVAAGSGCRAGVQLSPPGLGSARLRTAEEGGQAPADSSAPRPRRDPRAETQQGPTRARPERLKTAAGGGERAWKEEAAAAERASREGGGGRSASPGEARPWPQSKPGGRQAAAGSEPASRKAARGSPSGYRGAAR